MNPLARLAALPSLDTADPLRNRDMPWVRSHRGAVRRTFSLVIALLGPVAAALVTVDLVPVLGHATPLPLVAAIVLAAWFGGPVPGVLATAISAVIASVALLPPYGSFAVDSSGDRVQLVMLTATGLLVDAIAVLRARAEDRAYAAQRHAEDVLDRADVAARRLEALQHLATDLSEAETTEAIRSALLARASVSLLADRSAIVMLDPETGVARELEAVGPPPDYSPTETQAVDDAIAAVARTGEPVFNEGRAALRGGLPGRQHAIGAVPIRLSTGQGALAFTWQHPHPLPADRQAFIVALAGAGSAAIDRHRLFEAEIFALRQAEAASGYLSILADAGRTLGTTLAYDGLVSLLPELGIPRLGELGIVDLEEGGVTRRVVATHDPDLEEVARALERHPLGIDGMGRAASALVAGRATAIWMDDAAIERSVRSEEQGEAIRRIGPSWILSIPLAIQGATSGVLTFVRRSDQRFDLGELSVAEELGRRAGRALENARLHQQLEDLADLERRRAGELEAVLGAVEEGFLLADASGQIRSSNAAAKRVLGGPVKTVSELCDRLLDNAGHVLRSLPSQPEELRLRGRPNAWVEIASYRVHPSSGLSSSSVVIACRDVTAFRRGQALREAFLGLLSHELRTPVTTIYAAAAVLTRRGRELDPAVADEVLADVAAEADRLYRLIEDLMVLARFDEGLEIGSQPVLLQHLIPAAVHQEANRWPGVTFECRVEPELETVGGDETAIAQVVRNLLSNAAKYSPVGGHVDVEIRPEAGGVAVAVRDDGPGIDPAESEKIFDPFYRSPSTAALATGAGIGLYVSRRLVDAMGGRLSAAPADGGGSEFTFVLPTYR